jgi:hypothetical protein
MLNHGCVEPRYGIFPGNDVNVETKRFGRLGSDRADAGDRRFSDQGVKFTRRQQVLEIPNR